VNDADDVPRNIQMSSFTLPVNNVIAFGVRMAGLLCFIRYTGSVICTHCSVDIIINMEN
jgi:hypothetical protein